MYIVKNCDNCGQPGGSLVWEGYQTPIPDAAPAHYEWEQLFLCRECREDPEVRKHYHLADKEKGSASEG